MQVLKKAQEFQDDFAEVWSSLCVMSAKHGLPVPDILLGPEWKAPIQSMPMCCTAAMDSDNSFFGIKFYFGRMEKPEAIFVSAERRR